MEELTESLATSFSVTTDPNSTAAPHPRFAEYKRKTSNVDQDSRRKDILEQQKNRRFDYSNHARRLVEDAWESTEDLDDDDGEVAMDETPVKKRYRPGRYYRNQLMLSEWMVEVPGDFEEEWLMVMCPWGKRCLIVSARGATTAYGRNGYRVNSFPSLLPGGNRHQRGRYNDNAILDCIYHEVEKTFYVLDIMNWKNHPVYDSDTDFRFFWMMSKLQELPEVGEAGKINPYKFVPLQFHPCNKETLPKVFEQATQPFDGCLFYHKKAHYTFGASPLVVWLKPYMVGEMLSMDIPESMLQQKPANYSTYAAHLNQVKEQKDKIAKEREDRKAYKKKHRGPERSKQFKMDENLFEKSPRQPSDIFNNFTELMESKWLTEIPENIDTDWCTIACPVGQRCLVMAIDGETKCFSKKGYILPGYFLSVLPGGNGKEYGFGPTVVTLLDCIYCEEMLTYFILDSMMWASHDIKEYPYSDRMKFVKREISKRPEFKNITDLNMFKFVPLYHYDCTLEGLDLCLRQSTFEVDGLLFYKKDIQYKSGETDQVLWTKPYILPDVFSGVAVPKKLMSQKPDTYTNFESFAEDVINGKIKSKKNKKKKSKAFNPTVQLNLPPPEEPIIRVGKKKNKQKQPQGQGGNNMGRGYGRGMNSGQERSSSGRAVGGRGGNMDSYGRLLAGGDAARAVYGKGSVSGYNYYGDERDYYYADVGYGSDPRGRRERGNKQEPYRMSDMQSALSFYEYEGGRKPGRGRHYQLF